MITRTPENLHLLPNSEMFYEAIRFREPSEDATDLSNVLSLKSVNMHKDSHMSDQKHGMTKVVSSSSKQV